MRHYPVGAPRCRCTPGRSVSAAVPPDLLGKAEGTLNTMQQFGAVFGVAVVTAVFNAHGSLISPTAVTSGYHSALAVSAGASLLGALVALGIQRVRAGMTASGLTSILTTRCSESWP
jgi:hypothetical protein